MAFLTTLNALGDCKAGKSCASGIWSHVVVPSLAAATIIFFVVRWLLDRSGQTKED
jgi:hypothetical protein